jgi:predicted nucleotidyltransferase
VDAHAARRIVREVLAASHQEVIAAYLFGSTARGTHREGSDVDVGVLLADERRAP